MKENRSAYTQIRSALTAILITMLALALIACSGSSSGSSSDLDSDSGSDSGSENLVPVPIPVPVNPEDTLNRPVAITEINASIVAAAAYNISFVGELPNMFPSLATTASTAPESTRKVIGNFRVSALAELARDQLARVEQTPLQGSLSALSTRLEGCSEGGHITVTKTDSSYIIIFDNCKERYSWGEWYEETTTKGTIKISLKKIPDYSEGFGFEIDLQEIYSDSDNDFWTETFNGSFDFGFNSTYDYRLTIPRLTFTDNGRIGVEEYSYSLSIGNFSFFSKPDGDGFAVSYNGTYDSSGTDGLGGSITISTQEDIRSSWGAWNPHAGRVKAAGGGDSYLELVYAGTGVFVTVNGGTPTFYTWAAFEDWIMDIW